MNAHTIAEAPPQTAPGSRPRKSIWADIFSEARQFQGEWRRVSEPRKKSTVAQVASDIRNAASRAPEQRMRGIESDEKWDATWGEVDGRFYVWIRYLGKV